MGVNFFVAFVRADRSAKERWENCLKINHSDPFNSSQVRGDDFWKGFASAGFAQMAAPWVDDIDRGSHDGAATAKRVVTAAIVGGVASRLAGGSFENGAQTAAFARMYNDEKHPGDVNSESSNKKTRGQIEQESRELRRVRAEAIANGDIEGGLDTFATMKAGPLNVDAITPVGPGGDSIPKQLKGSE